MANIIVSIAENLPISQIQKFFTRNFKNSKILKYRTVKIRVKYGLEHLVEGLRLKTPQKEHQGLAKGKV